MEKAKDLFNSYKGSPNTFPVDEIDDKRCKIQSIKKFNDGNCDDWDIDHWWSKEEKIILGIEKEEKIVTVEDFSDMLNDLSLKIKKYNKVVDGLKK